MKFHAIQVSDQDNETDIELKNIPRDLTRVAVSIVEARKHIFGLRRICDTLMAQLSRPTNSRSGHLTAQFRNHVKSLVCSAENIREEGENLLGITRNAVQMVCKPTKEYS